MRTFHQLFGKSPFVLLVEHTRRVHRTVELIRPLFEAFLDEDWDRCEALYKKISKREHKADLEKNKIRDQLPRSIFLPVDRGDVLKYLKEQDSIADAAEDVAVLITIRKTPCPEELKPLVLDFVDQVIRTSEELVAAGSVLTELVESRFGGPEVERVLTMVANVNDQEWEADKRQRALSRAIMEREDELDAISIVIWMRIITTLGAIANHAENTGDMLRMMLARG
jgi:predicted phosphate transport protein (TIGR00153 family)